MFKIFNKIFGMVFHMEQCNDEKRNELEERLNAHPRLKSKVEKLLDIIENKNKDMEKADDVEDSLISELRKMGSDVMHEWAESQNEIKEYELNSRDKTWKDIKKTLLVYKFWSNRDYGTNI